MTEKREELNYWFDAQIVKYLQQIVSVFSFIQVEYETGVLKTVPVRLALKDRMVAHILKNNSENIANSIPAMTVNILSLELNSERRQNPTHIENHHITERYFDEENQKYTNQPGQSYTITRHMPVPYLLTINLDIATSNELQKHQILEQILCVFNPSIDFQTSRNVFDWTSINVLELTGIEYSNNTVPIGTENSLDVATLTFQTTIFISPPALLTQQKLIHQINTNIQENINIEASLKKNPNVIYDTDENDLYTRLITTPGNYKICVYENYIELLNENEDNFENGELLSWRKLFEQYGYFRPNVSQIRLKITNNPAIHNNDIILLIQYNNQNENQLFYTLQPETLPETTLPDVNGYINPHKTFPGKNLIASKGDKYILSENIKLQQKQNDFNEITYDEKLLETSMAWGDLEAYQNDIIEFDGSKWKVIFSSKDIKKEHWTNNITTKKLLQWTGEEWLIALLNIYDPGYWRLYL